MKIILLKDIKGIGRKFEEKEVSSGYATNYLIPRKFAVPATGGAGAQIKVLKEGEEKSRENTKKILSENVSKLSEIEIKITAKANDKGHLFASINKEKIVELLKSERGIEIDTNCIILEHPIKEVGQHNIPIKIEGSKETHFVLVVDPA